MNENHTEDSLLIDKARQGNKEALNILMTKYYPRVYASLYAYTKSKEDAEDLAQATFIKAWKRLNLSEAIVLFLHGYIGLQLILLKIIFKAQLLKSKR